MNFKYTAMFVGLLALTACETAPKSDGAGAGTGTGSVNGMTPGSGSGSGNTVYRAGSQEELDATIGSRIYFDTDKSTIRSDARQTIQSWAAWLNRYPSVTVTVEGNADERGTREYNLALGERRAAAARDALVGLGVSSNRVATISYGKERPEVMGSDEQSWARNRRDNLKVN
jgi:peptidoglycan-associated lipoprotein